MKVNELFNSIQGEGRYSGKPSYFIRTVGCNLRCKFCDTKYAFEEGKEIDIESLVESTKPYEHIVITGGEPLLQEDLPYLLKRLSNKTVEVETNGTLYLPEIIRYAKFNVSPKLDFINKNYEFNLKKWSKQAIFKYVIRDLNDFEKAKELSKKLEVDEVILMPEGTNSDKMLKDTHWLAELTKYYWKEAQVMPRLHILLYGNKRGV